MEALPKIQYCQKKRGNFKATCSGLAFRIIELKSSNTGQITYQYRCKDCNEDTAKKKIIATELFDQYENIKIVNKYLYSLVGKIIRSKMHTAKQLEVRYVKPDKCGVMCLQPITKKWKFVYYNQIILL